MNRGVVIIVGAFVVVIVGIVVWQVVLPFGATSPGVGTSVPAPRKFDTTGGQEMRPRWHRQEGEGDGAAH